MNELSRLQAHTDDVEEKLDRALRRIERASGRIRRLRAAKRLLECQVMNSDREIAQLRAELADERWTTPLTPLGPQLESKNSTSAEGGAPPKTDPTAAVRPAVRALGRRRGSPPRSGGPAPTKGARTS